MEYGGIGPGIWWRRSIKVWVLACMIFFSRVRLLSVAKQCTVWI